MIRKFFSWLLGSQNELLKLKARVEKLEEENIETTNELYELRNSMEGIDSRIDMMYLETHSNDVSRSHDF